MTDVADRIEKKVLLRAPRAKVWRAISDSHEFGSWFGVKFDGEFSPGTRLNGIVVPTTVDPEVAREQKTYEGAPFEITVERVESEKLFSFRWHPFAVDPKVDYSKERATLVEFTLADAEGGTLLTLTETGFDGVSLARRAKAFAMNDRGWTMQLRLVEKYVARAER